MKIARLRELLLEEGIAREAASSFEVTDHPENKLKDLIRKLPPGTALTREGTRFGLSVPNGYALKRGKDIVLIQFGLLKDEQTIISPATLDVLKKL